MNEMMRIPCGLLKQAHTHESYQHIGLSIAGFDPCGGAGVLADVQTLQQCKVQGMAVLTATTIQNDAHLASLDWMSFRSIKDQLEVLFDRYNYKVVKIGIVERLDTLDLILDWLHTRSPDIRVIWDPVLKSTSGFEFIESLDSHQLSELIDKLFLITPNRLEHQQLTEALGTDQINTNVLLKGGHNNGTDTSDMLIDKTGSISQIPGQRIMDADKHGTGCVLSSAIMAGLIKGMKLKSACTFGKRYVESYIKSGVGQLGAHYEIEL